MNFTNQIKTYYRSKLDMDIVGIAPASALAGEPEGHRPEDILPGCKSIIVFGRKITDGAIQSLMRVYEDKHEVSRSGYDAYAVEHAPTLLMVDATFAAACYIEDSFKEIATPVPFGILQSMVWDKYPVPYFADPYGQGMPIDIYKAAMAAGLGEYGWSNRFLTPKYGPRVTLSAVLTTMELEYNKPYSGEKLCDPAKCGICVKECPTCAIPAYGEECAEKCIEGKCIEVAAIKPTRCAVASVGFRKGYHPRSVDLIDTNDPTEDQLAEALPKLKQLVSAVNHYPRALCERCMIYCPVGHWKENFEDTGLTDNAPEYSK